MIDSSSGQTLSKCQCTFVHSWILVDLPSLKKGLLRVKVDGLISSVESAGCMSSSPKIISRREVIKFIAKSCFDPFKIVLIN